MKVDNHILVALHVFLLLFHPINNELSIFFHFCVIISNTASVYLHWLMHLIFNLTASSVLMTIGLKLLLCCSSLLGIGYLFFFVGYILSLTISKLSASECLVLHSLYKYKCIYITLLVCSNRIYNVMLITPFPLE